MALTLRQWIDRIYVDYCAADGSGSGVGYYLRQAANQLIAGNMENAGDMLYIAGTTQYDFTEEVLSRYTHQGFNTVRAFDWIEANWPEDGEPPPEYELTAKKICEAWAVNDFEDRGITIAFIDRMRQILWDEPFYVVWAARPEQ